MTSTASRLIFGFIAGALATLIVHQSVVFILGQTGMIPAGGAWATRPYGPLQVPTILNQMFWGGLWGSLFAVYSGQATPEQSDRIARWCLDHYDLIVKRGQVRHLPKGTFWGKAQPQYVPAP